MSPDDPGPGNLPTSAASSTIYFRPTVAGELRQGEILSDVHQYVRDHESQLSAEIVHPLTIVASQDCDLLWDFESKSVEPRQLNSVLMFEVQLAAPYLKAVKGNDLRRPIRNNKNERYHVLEAVPLDLDIQGLGFGALLVDFKRLFAISAVEFYQQLERGLCKRRACLEMPYREHFQARAAAYLQRVTLPTPHSISDD